MNKVLDVSIRNDSLLTPSDGDGGDGANAQTCHWRWTSETSQSSQCWCDSASALLKRVRRPAEACTSVAATPVTIAWPRRLLAGVSASFAKNFGEKGRVTRWHSLSGVHEAVAGVQSEPEQG